MSTANKASVIRRRIFLIGSLMTAIAVTVLVFQTFFCAMTFEDENRIRRFHNEPANSMDMVLIGSSDVYAGYSAGLAYKQYGIKSYPYAIAEQTCLLWEAMVEDVLKTQSPDVILIETYGATYTETHFNKHHKRHNSAIEAAAYKLLDTFPMSPLKLQYSMKMAHYIKQSDTLSFFMPFIKYHGRYGAYLKNAKNLLYLYKTKTSPFKGNHTQTKTVKNRKTFDLASVKETSKLSKTAEQNLRAFLEYCKTVDNTKFVFINFPVLAREKGSYKYRGHKTALMVGKIAQEYGFDFINLQERTGELGITHKDFYDYGHVNIYGQKKITAAVCELLKERYGVPVKGKHTTPDNDKEWNESAKFYDDYYRFADEAIRAGDKMKLIDNQETLDKVRKGYHRERKKKDAYERVY